MNLGRTAIPNSGVKHIYPTAAFEAVTDEEVVLVWMEGSVQCSDVFNVASGADMTALLTVNSGADLDVGVLAGSVDLQSQPSISSVNDVTPNPLTDAFITAFKFTISAVDYVASITGGAIAVTLPALTVVTALTPVATISNRATVSPAFASANFTTPKVYTVTAEDGSTDIEYTVTVTVTP